MLNQPYTIFWGPFFPGRFFSFWAQWFTATTQPAILSELLCILGAEGCVMDVDRQGCHVVQKESSCVHVYIYNRDP